MMAPTCHNVQYYIITLITQQYSSTITAAVLLRRSLQYYCTNTTITTTATTVYIPQLPIRGRVRPTQPRLTAPFWPGPSPAWWGPASCDCRPQNPQPHRRRLPRGGPQGTVRQAFRRSEAERRFGGAVCHELPGQAPVRWGGPA
nr:glutathione S-transferase [Saccharina japonica]